MRSLCVCVCFQMNGLCFTSIYKQLKKLVVILLQMHDERQLN